jgi:hypothetical protein
VRLTPANSPQLRLQQNNLLCIECSRIIFILSDLLAGTSVCAAVGAGPASRGRPDDVGSDTAGLERAIGWLRSVGDVPATRSRPDDVGDDTAGLETAGGWLQSIGAVPATRSRPDDGSDIAALETAAGWLQSNGAVPATPAPSTGTNGFLEWSAFLNFSVSADDRGRDSRLRAAADHGSSSASSIVYTSLYMSSSESS